MYIRQLPIYNKLNQQIYYAGTGPYNLVATVGTLPSARQFPTYPNWIDATNNVSDLTKLKITWTEQRDNTGTVVPGANQIKKTASGTLKVTGESYQLFKQWLADDVSAALNSVEVKLEDTSCGFYEGLVVKPSDIQWCEDKECEFSVTLKQKDELMSCIKKTFIADNWQGWFPKDGKPLNGKKHPRFAYCKEQRPNGMMIALWYMMGQVMAPIAGIMFGVVLLLNGLIFAINGIIIAINTIPGVNVSLINFVSPTAVFDSFNIYFVETAGCGREHPAPLIRDYITNVCDKCGIQVDAITAPIFFAPTITIETSDVNRVGSNNGVITATNPHYNATYFYPQVKRGIRRFESVNILGASPANNTEFWIDENAPLLTLDLFLDQLKGLYNAEWRVKNGKLYFWRKDWFLDGGYIYDFTQKSSDRLKILEGLCFEPSEVKYPAICHGIYATDASDMNESGGSNGAGQMNGILSFGNTNDNPNFEGILDKSVQFGATKFNLDGASGCYYYDALQQLANAGLLNLTTLFQAGTIARAMHDYGDYALLMQGETCALPKVIIWNGLDYTNARALTLKAPWPGASSYPTPDPNPVYNTAMEQWQVRHEPITKVLGSALTLSPNPPGIYYVANFFGAPVIQNPAELLNYPMYFEPFYYDTLWDWFHWIDDPLRNPVMNFNWRVKIKLCCDDLHTCQVLNDASGIVLGNKVKLPFQYYKDGKIREITVSYDTKDTYGQYIELSGTL